MIMATTKDRKRLKLGRSVMKINESTLAFEHTDPDELRVLKNCASTHLHDMASFALLIAMSGIRGSA